MTDTRSKSSASIVERLRDRSGQLSVTPLLDEAADEIERLHRELSYHVHTDEDIKVQNAEIERLRDLLSDQRDEHALKAKAEIERLRMKIGSMEDALGGALSELIKEQAENEWLHEELRVTVMDTYAKAEKIKSLTRSRAIKEEEKRDGDHDATGRTEEDSTATVGSGRGGEDDVRGDGTRE